MSLKEATRALRLALGDTQQQFASRCNLSISSVVRYERTRPPKGRMLTLFQKLSLAADRKDLYGVFAEALDDELGAEQSADADVEDAQMSSARRDLVMASQSMEAYELGFQDGLLTAEREAKIAAREYFARAEMLRTTGNREAAADAQLRGVTSDRLRALLCGHRKFRAKSFPRSRNVERDVNVTSPEQPE